MSISAQQMKQIQAMIQKQQSGGDGLLSFRAGRCDMKYENGKKMVYAKKKRGKIRLDKDENGILHFQWHDRIKKTKELDLLVFPGDATFVGPIAECKDGQVFVLKIASGNRREFFWMQETAGETEEEKKVEETRLKGMTNLLLGKAIDAGEKTEGDKKPGEKATGGAAAAANPLAAALGGAAGGAGGADMQAFQAALLQALGGQGGAAAAQAQQQAAQQRNQVMQQLRERIQNGPDLADIVNGEATAPLTEPDAVGELAEHLPEGMRDAQSIEEQLNSPQVRGTLSTLQRAINGENGPLLFQQMGLGGQGGNAQDLIGTTAFLERLIAQNPAPNAEADNSEQKDDDKEKSDDKNDGPDKMDTDES